MKNFRLSDMRDLARDEAYHIEATQAALVYCGLRQAPDPAEIEKAAKLEAITSLCARSSDPKIVARLRELAWQEAAAAQPHAAAEVEEPADDDAYDRDAGP